MSFAADEFRDLVQLLEAHPEWRGELRRLVLSDELLDLPAALERLTEKVEALADAQRRTEVSLGSLAAKLEALTDKVEALTGTVEALAQKFEALAQKVEALTEKVEALADAQRRTEERLSSLGRSMDQLVKLISVLEGKVSKLDGYMLEDRYRRHPAGYFGKILRRIKVLSDEDLSDLLEPALAAGKITRYDFDEVRLADLVARGRRHEDGQEIYLVVEISWGVGVSDVQRASSRALALERAGVKTIPMVAGESVVPDADKAAKLMDVWQVTNGVVQAPKTAGSP